MDECKPLERGHVNAQYELGVAYSKGSGVPTDPAAAAAWFGKAAEQGDGESQFTLGCLLEEGKGVEQNHELAATWFKRAAEQAEPSELVTSARGQRRSKRRGAGPRAGGDVVKQ